MTNLPSKSMAQLKVIACLSFLLYVVLRLWPGHASIYAATASNWIEKVTDTGSVNIPPAQVAAATDTFQDFDLLNTGTPYVEGIHLPPPATGPQRLPGDPTGAGQFIRLAFTTTVPNHNSIAFTRTKSGGSDLVMADFDFRLTPSSANNNRADGLGFALLNTTNYGITGTVAPINVAEEPNFVGSLGIGFDIYRSDPPLEINNNHISLHFNGQLVREFDARPALDLAGGQWIHARIIVRSGGGHSEVTVILIPYGRPAVTIIDRFPIFGLTPYEGRAYFAARSGGLSAEHDLDNVQVQFLNLSQSAVAFSTSHYSVVETEGKQVVTVTRLGNLSSTVTVRYTTTNQLTATPGSDYTLTSGALTFKSGETSKSFNIPILNDNQYEGDESLLVSLGGPTGGGVGGPAVAKVTIIDDEAARAQGHWDELIPLPVVPIHTHLLPTGEVLFWDRHDHHNAWEGKPYLWNPTNELIRATPVLTYDIFCSGHAFLADGQLLVTGGHILDTVGEEEASLYNPYSNTWTRLPKMNLGRWYPSNVTLPSGDMLVLGGTYLADKINPLPQVWQVGQNSWRNLTTAQQSGPLQFADYYPFLYVAPNGQVFNAGPQQVARYLNPSGTGTWTNVATSTLEYRDYGSSVMYDEGKVLIVGGNPRGDSFVPSATAEVIDLNNDSPTWRTVEPMQFGRRHLNTTLLPDGQVLATGGSSAAGFDNLAGAVLAAEMWDPKTEQWRTLASQSRFRGYHSVALLLPDGRVLVGGGGHPDPNGGPQYNFEIFSPPYLFKGPKPTITEAPRHIIHSLSFLIKTPVSSTIQAVNLIRLGSVTHAFNQNQRLNPLAFTKQAEGLTVTAPLDPTLAPPGHYMLFILNDKGVPSLAHIVRLLPPNIYLPHIQNQ